MTEENGSIYKQDYVNGVAGRITGRYWINTLSGIYEISAEKPVLMIQDLAAGLAQEARFSGQFEEEPQKQGDEIILIFYTVAEHCIHTAEWVFSQTGDARLAITALLHDGPEFCLGDIGSPIKYWASKEKGIDMSGYLELEKVVFGHMTDNFPLFIYPLPDIVVEADARILVDEFHMRFPGVDPALNNIRGQPLGITPMFWQPQQAFNEYISCYRKYEKLAPK